MDTWMPMSTKIRHNRIVTFLIGELINLIKKKEVNVLHEECSLVYWGKKSEPTSLSLINISEIENIDEFKEEIMDDLYYVQPDFMMFKDNPYLENKRQTRTAGCPDLIVEIWSKGNTRDDRAFLQNLYATSPVTEHWYIEQDSNEVICYLGRNKLENQSLSDILVTRSGLKFDLRYLTV